MGIGTVARPFAKLGVEEAYDMVGKIMISGEGEGLKSEAGKIITKTFSDMFANVKRETQQHLSTLPSYNANTMKTIQQVVQAQNEAVYLGPKRARLSQLLKQAAIERNDVHAQNLADMASVALREEQPKPFKNAAGQITNWRTEGGVSSHSPYKAVTKDGLSAKTKEILATTYLGRVAIPHTMQHFNVMLTEGFKPWAKAMADLTTKQGRDAALQFATDSGALFEETYRQMQDVAQGKDTIWHKMFHMPLFNFIRKAEIIHAANAGKYAMLDAARSSGKAADLTLEMLGLEPAAVRYALRIGNKQVIEDSALKAGYRSADENLFIDRALKTPWTWDYSSASKMITLYKSFQYREGKLIKDSIKRSFMSGDPRMVARTLAIVGTVFPIAGKMISMMENLATAHSPNENKSIWKVTGNEYADEYLDSLGHMAAFGIWYSMFRAAAFRRATDYMAGPIISLPSDIFYGVSQASKGNYSTGAKAIARRVPVVGPAIAAHYDDLSGYVSDTLDNILN